MFALRLFGGFVLIVLVYAGIQQFYFLYRPDGLNAPITKLLAMVLGAGLGSCGVVFIFLTFVRLIEGAYPKTFETRRAAVELALGGVIGIGLSAISVLLLWMAGFYHVKSIAPSAQWPAILLGALPVPIISGVAEEILFRGILLRQIARSACPAVALLISGSFFGLVHLLDNGSTLLGAIGLVLEAGILLGAAYLLTRRLWLAIGLHFAWNFMQAGVVGGALSGLQVHAIVQASASGPTWLSGGKFGIEGSTITAIVCGSAGLGLLVMASSRGLQWFKPAKM